MPLHRVSRYPPENLGVSRSLLAVGPSRSQVQGPHCAQRIRPDEVET